MICCTNCGEANEQDAKLCKYCGSKTAGTVSQSEPLITRVKEFKFFFAYNAWLAANGEKVKIIDVSTTKRWGYFSNPLGILSNRKTYTVTYQAPANAPVLPPSSAAKWSPKPWSKREWAVHMMIVAMMLGVVAFVIWVAVSSTR